MADAESTLPWYTVNMQLLPVKGIYFTIFAAIGSLLPFIPIFMKQLGLSATEMGIIYGTMPFIAFFIRPLFGAIADKTQRHKLVLIVSALMTGLCYCLLLLTPDQEMMSVKTQLQCSQQDSYIKDCHAVGHQESCHIGLTKLMTNPLLATSDSVVPCQALCSLSVTASTQLHVCFTNDIGMYSAETCQAVWNESHTIEQLHFTIDSLGNVLQNEVIGQELTYDGQICKTFDLKNVTYVDKKFWQILCSAESVLDCDINCSNQFKKSCKQFGKTFWIFISIFLFCNIFFAPIVSLIDAIAYVMLADRRSRWGHQRLWGTIGFALFAITSTSIMDYLSKSSQKINYSGSFFIFCGFSILTAVIAFLVPISSEIRCHQMFKNMSTLLKHPEIVFFMFIVTCFGVMNSVTEVCLFWYLQDLGSTQVNLGLCLVFSCSLEVVLLFCAGKIIKKIGHVPCLYLALLAYVVRFFGYSFLTSPWYVLPIELLHGVCFGLMFAAATSYASIITPQGMAATVQGLVSGLYFGFGKGIGSIVTGKMFDSESGLGAIWTFRFYGFFALGILILYASVHTLFFRKKETEIPEDTKVQPEMKDDDAIPEAPVTSEDRLLSAVDVDSDL